VLVWHGLSPMSSPKPRARCLSLVCSISLFLLRVGALWKALPTPDFLDCTAAHHVAWARFRTLFVTGVADANGFPLPSHELLDESTRVFNQWRHMLALHNEDYPPGSVTFYRACHFGEHSDYCLYGHVAALAYIAKWREHFAIKDAGFIEAAVRLLSWTFCLDYLESSSWGFSVLDLLDIIREYIYPVIHHTQLMLEIGRGSGSHSVGTLAPLGSVGRSAAVGRSPQDSSQGRRTFWLFEFGTHAALSTEPRTMLERSLPGHELVYTNFISSPYRGGADAYLHPFPEECFPTCPGLEQQSNSPYIFPYFSEAEKRREDFQAMFQAEYLSKPELKSSTAFLCTTPVIYCLFFAGLKHTLLGYFGLPLLYMVPREDWGSWISRFIELARSPSSLFVANNAMLAEQVAWQTGVGLHVMNPVALYVEDTYYPVRWNDVLVPEPREACVLNCLLSAFTPPGYPLRFQRKADTDRTFRTFSTFRMVLLFPHDLALMSFYEFYAMSIPLFLPSHLSKYVFPYSASVPLLDFVPAWLVDQQTMLTNATCGISAPLCPLRPVISPFNLASSAGVTHWSKFMDYFVFPGLQLFPSIAALIGALPEADVHNISRTMRDFHMSRIIQSTDYWEGVARMALDTARHQR